MRLSAAGNEPAAVTLVHRVTSAFKANHYFEVAALLLRHNRVSRKKALCDNTVVIYDGILQYGNQLTADSGIIDLQLAKHRVSSQRFFAVLNGAIVRSLAIRGPIDGIQHEFFRIDEAVN